MAEAIETPAVGWPFAGLRLESRSIPAVLLLLVVSFLVIAPLIFLFINSFHVTEQQIGGASYWGLDGWRAAFTSPGIRGALIDTFLIMIARQGIATVVAIFFVWLLTRTDLPGRNWLEFGFWLAFFIPTLPALLGWILLLHPGYGVVNQQLQRLWFIDSSPFNIYSFWGIVWVHLVTGTIAIKVVLLAPAFRNMDAALEEASRVCGVSPIATLWRVVVPIMLPAILVVTLMSLITSFQAFEIELILGTRAGIDVFSTLIYRFIKSEPSLPGHAAALSIIVMAFMIPLVLLQMRYVKRRLFTTITGQYKPTLLRLRRLRWPAFALVAGTLLVFTVLPMTFVLLGSFMKIFGYFDLPQPYTLENYGRVASDPLFMRSIGNTLVLGAGAGIFSVALFSLVAYVVVKTRFALRELLDFISWLPWAVPGVLFALGILWTVLGIPILRPLHATTLVLVVAISLGVITVGVQMFKATLLQIGNELEDASRVSGGNWWFTYRRISLPIVAPTIVAVGLYAFALAVRDVARVALLASSSNRPLSLLQLDFMVQGNFGPATVIGILVTVIIVIVAVVPRLFGLRMGAGE